MRKLLERLFKEEEGQGLVEYGLILAGIAVVAVIAITQLGDGLKNVFSGVEESIDGAGNEIRNKIEN